MVVEHNKLYSSDYYKERFRLYKEDNIKLGLNDYEQILQLYGEDQIAINDDELIEIGDEILYLDNKWVENLFSRYTQKCVELKLDMDLIEKCCLEDKCEYMRAIDSALRAYKNVGDLPRDRELLCEILERLAEECGNEPFY